MLAITTRYLAPFLLLGLLFSIPTAARAQVPGLTNLIGGKIILSEICCNGVKITVGPPKAGIFLYVPGVSTLYPYFNIFTPGPWVLGTAFGVATCQKLASFIPCAIPEPVPGGIIRMIGSSGL